MSPEEKKRVEIFLAKTGQEKAQWDDEDRVGNLQKSCGYVRVFDNDPIKAAAFCVTALQNRQINWQKRFEEICKNFPSSVQENLMKWWDEKPEEDHPLIKGAMQAASKYADKKMDEEFFSVMRKKISDYLENVKDN